MIQPSEYSFEDAISRTGFGKFNYILIVLSGLMLGCGFLEASCINMILPIAGCELDLSNSQKGLLGSISYIGIILSSHFWGFMADTKGRKKVIAPALCLSFIFTVISTFAKSFTFILIFRFLSGFCICAPQSITYAFLGEYHCVKRRGRVLLFASFLYGLFCLINPLNAFVFINQDSWYVYIPYLDINYGTWRLFLLMCGVPSVISAIALITLIPESPKYTYARGDESRTLKILQKIYKFNTGRPIEDYEVKCLEKDSEFSEGNDNRSKGFFKFVWYQTVPLFQHPHLKNTLTACYLQFGLCLASNGFFTFFPEILNKVFIWLNDNPSQTSTVCDILESYDKNVNISSIAGDTCVTKLESSTFINVTILTALFSILWLISSVIINKTGKLVIIATILFAGGISSILIMFIEYPRVSIYLYFLLLIANVNMSIVNASTVELYPTTLRAMAVSISLMFGRIGSFTGSNFVGLMIKNYCFYTWLLPATLSISGGLLAFTIPNINKRIK
ncbi:synaptic vesicle glycoprotein 2B-like [Chironomus tepperi]|uniref:synaptic vesicle glycoprotein 2B-like n=1 Tax=Chironomus tepperi TaxID=113505 RepID=UPI00391EF380